MWRFGSKQFVTFNTGFSLFLAGFVVVVFCVCACVCVVVVVVVFVLLLFLCFLVTKSIISCKIVCKRRQFETPRGPVSWVFFFFF